MGADDGVVGNLVSVEGLLVAGRIHSVAGLRVLAPASVGGEPWCRLDAGDYATRSTTWIRQIILHTTGGLWPQYVRPGAGHPGHARQVADMWSGADRGDGGAAHSAAQLVVDFDGSVACLADLAYAAAYHAEGSNHYSVGVEMCTMPDGSIYEATLTATARLMDALCWPLLPVPRQYPRGPYLNRPLVRMETGSGKTRRQLGGPGVVGVLGHRDNTSERGPGDPGDAIWRELAAAGFEGLDYSTDQDLSVARDRQRTLVGLGARISVDGLVGPSSLAAAADAGFSRWRDVR